MKSYGGLRDLLARAHGRVKKSMGDQFGKEVLDEIPLVLDDEICVDIAKKFGWDPAWMAKKATNKRKAPEAPLLEMGQ